MASAACADREAGRLHQPAPFERVQITVGDVPVTVRVVNSSADRARGLAGVQDLRPDAGMLFLYRKPRVQHFWMKGCLIALDIAFLDENGRVLQVDTLDPPLRSNATPARTRRPPPSAMVLEMPAGFFQRHGLGDGSLVAIPDDVRRIEADS